MNLHQTQTEYNAGIDLHTRNLYVCVCDREGKVHVHRNVRENNLAYLEKLLAPFKHDLTVCCESTCNWYFLSDFCDHLGVEFVLGHAFYIRAIAQNKKKNDRVDSRILADLLRNNMMPYGYAMGPGYRNLRELMRRRLLLVQKRSSLQSSLTMSMYMQGLEPLTTAEKRIGNRRDAILSRPAPQVLTAGWNCFLNVIEAIDKEVSQLEDLIEEGIGLFGREEDLACLTTFPGMALVLGGTILLEIGDINRFPSVGDFASYARLITPEGESAGKRCGKRPSKIGNPYLNWAFAEASITMPRWCTPVRHYHQSMVKKKGLKTARNILRHRIGKAAYFCLNRQTSFDVGQFLKGKERFLQCQEDE